MWRNFIHFLTAVGDVGPSGFIVNKFGESCGKIVDLTFIQRI